MPKVYIIQNELISDFFQNNPFEFKHCIEKAFKMHFDKVITQPVKQYLIAENNPFTRIISMPVMANDKSFLPGVKWIGSHPNNHKIKLERANSLIILNDINTLAPFAILEGNMISSMRTLASSLILIERLMKKPEKFGIIGMGKLGKLHVEFIPKFFSSVKEINCYSATAQFDEMGSPFVKKHDSYSGVINNSEVVITTTTPKNPYISFNELTKVDHNTKLFLNISLADFLPEVYIYADHIIVDDWGQCSNSKKVFREALCSGKLDKNKVSELSDLLYGDKKDQILSGIIISNLIGMSIEDIVIANWIISVLDLNNVPFFETGIN